MYFLSCVEIKTIVIIIIITPENYYSTAKNSHCIAIKNFD